MDKIISFIAGGWLSVTLRSEEIFILLYLKRCHTILFDLYRPFVFVAKNFCANVNLFLYLSAVRKIANYDAYQLNFITFLSNLMGALYIVLFY